MQDCHADRARRAAAEEQDRLTPISVAERLAAVWQVSVADGAPPQRRHRESPSAR